MLIDCDTCSVRDLACADCFVTHLVRTPVPTDLPGVPVALDEAEASAIAVLADHGLVPPLRLAQG